MELKNLKMRLFELIDLKPQNSTDTITANLIINAASLLVKLHDSDRMVPAQEYMGEMLQLMQDMRGYMKEENERNKAKNANKESGNTEPNNPQ